jgi:hypothetical protein
MNGDHARQALTAPYAEVGGVPLHAEAHEQAAVLVRRLLRRPPLERERWDVTKRLALLARCVSGLLHPVGFVAWRSGAAFVSSEHLGVR